jgi:hypothetical protein
MSLKGKRKSRESSGARKFGKANRNRRGRAIAKGPEANLIRHQSDHRWPDKETLEKAGELAMKKQPRSRAKSKPMQLGFSLLDLCIDKASTHKLLLAASLKIKKVKRYPGYVLERVYNLKGRVIELI